MRRSLIKSIAVVTAFGLVAAACGRVDLEDLTPEAVKTEEAADAVTQTALAESDTRAHKAQDEQRGEKRPRAVHAFHGDLLGVRLAHS